VDASGAIVQTVSNVAAGDNAKILTLIPGSNWEPFGGKAYNPSAPEAKTSVEARIAQVAPLTNFVLNPEANPMARAMVAQQFLW